jgi:glycosyltransferase involved in cell wall biosynthesis
VTRRATVAVVTKNDQEVDPGGDVIQARAIARFLDAAGGDVAVVSDLRKLGESFDYAILFNLSLSEDTWVASAVCRAVGVPYVLFPVYWDLRSAIPLGHRRIGSRLLPAESRRRVAARRASVLPRLASVMRATKTTHRDLAWRSPRSLRREVVRHAMAVCPNSMAELTHLEAALEVEADDRWTVIHNGIWTQDMSPGVDWCDREDVIASVGSLSPRKNSLTLIGAAEKTGARLAIVGRRPRRDDGYGRRVARRIAAPESFLEGRSHDEVLDLLRRVKGHAQVSFVETPGLASLEAAACGAGVVVSDFPVVREYFGEWPIFVDPYDMESVASAFTAVLRTEPPPELREFVLEKYDWRTTLQPLAMLLGI